MQENIEIQSILADKPRYLPCCKPSQVQMVERKNAAGNVLEIITVISMTEYKALQPTAYRGELSFKESTR